MGIKSLSPIKRERYEFSADKVAPPAMLEESLNVITEPIRLVYLTFSNIFCCCHGLGGLYKLHPFNHLRLDCLIRQIKPLEFL